MTLTLSYAFVRFDRNDFISFTIGDGGVKSISWRKNNFLFVVYDDHVKVLNLNKARHIAIREPPK